MKHKKPILAGLMTLTVVLMVVFWLLPARKGTIQRAFLAEKRVQFNVEPPPPPKNPPFSEVLRAMAEILKAASPIVTAVLAVKVHRKGKKR